MAIIDDFDAIAKRLRELKSPAAKSAHEIAELEKWRDLARETARAYLANRRRGVLSDRPGPARRQPPASRPASALPAARTPPMR